MSSHPYKPRRDQKLLPQRCVWANSITLPPQRVASIADLDECVSAHRQNHRIGAASVRLFQHPFNHVLRAGVDRVTQPEPRGNGMALWIQVRCQHPRASAAGQYGVHQPDRPLTDHENGVVRSQIRASSRP